MPLCARPLKAAGSLRFQDGILADPFKKLTSYTVLSKQSTAGPINFLSEGRGGSSVQTLVLSKIGS